MSTDLTKVDSAPENGVIRYASINEYSALSATSEVRRALKANMDEGEPITEADLMRVKTPAGGGVQWCIPEVSGDVYAKDITGILVFQARQGTLWKSLDPGDDPPIVVTRDMKYGRINVPEEKIEKEMLEELKRCEVPGQPGIVEWDKLSYTQFGTGKQGIGKFAKESRPVFILRKGDAFPLMIRVGSGSITNIKRFIMQLKVEYWRAVIKLTLTKEKSKGGIDYSEVHPTLVDTLSVEDGLVVQEQYTNRLRASWMAGKIAVEEDGQQD